MINIYQTNIEKTYPLTLNVPEFVPHYPIEKYYERLNDRPHLILRADYDGEAAGFKIGYEIEPKIFYSWVGHITHENAQSIPKHAAFRNWQWFSNYRRGTTRTYRRE